ncbi:hypothetical protein B5S31_g1539 [[Candida] boidinii]|nr:hypothetical protein B5S31_g1539 [[Candida] boidinii]
MSFLEGVSINSFEFEFDKFISQDLSPVPNFNPTSIFTTPKRENNTTKKTNDSNSRNNSTGSSLIKRIKRFNNESISIDKLPMNGSYSNGSNSPLGIRTPLSYENHEMQFSHLLPQLGIFRHNTKNNNSNSININHNICNISSNFNNFNIYDFDTSTSYNKKKNTSKLQLQNKQIGLPSPSNATDGIDDDTISIENEILPSNLQKQNNVLSTHLQVLTPSRTLLVPDVVTTSTSLGFPNWKTVYQNPNTNHGSATYSIFNSINTPIREIDKHFDQLHAAIPTIYNSTPNSNEKNNPHKRQLISEFETFVKAFESRGDENSTNVTNVKRRKKRQRKTDSQNIELKSNTNLHKEINELLNDNIPEKQKKRKGAIRKSNLKSKKTKNKKKKKVEFNICKDIFEGKVLKFENSVNKVLQENNAFFPITKNTLQSNKEKTNDETNTLDNPEPVVVKRKRGRPRGKSSALKLNKDLSIRNELYDFSKKVENKKPKQRKPRRRKIRKSINFVEDVIDKPTEVTEDIPVESIENQTELVKENENMNENKNKETDEDYQYQDADSEQTDFQSSSSKYSKSKVCRSKNGCWTCRLRRKRCPEQRPICSECQRLGIPCDGYDGDKPDYMISSNKAKIKMQEIKTITLSKRNKRLISRRGYKKRKRVKIKHDEEVENEKIEENEVEDQAVLV